MRVYHLILPPSLSQYHLILPHIPLFPGDSATFCHSSQQSLSGYHTETGSLSQRETEERQITASFEAVSRKRSALVGGIANPPTRATRAGAGTNRRPGAPLGRHAIRSALPDAAQPCPAARKPYDSP